MARIMDCSTSDALFPQRLKPGEFSTLYGTTEQQKEKAFFQLAERFRAASDPEQVKQLGDQLGRFVFGE